MKKIVAAFVALVSTGWLIPMWYGAHIYVQFWRSEGWPLLLGHPHLNSYDFLLAAQSAFKIAFIWLSVVVFAWSYIAVRYAQERRTGFPLSRE